MSAVMRREVERKIAEALINEGIAAGYSIMVNNGEECTDPSTDVNVVLEAMFSVDEEHLVFYKEGKRVGWVFFVYGNGGWDVICDYSTNLDPIMTEANKLSDHYSG